MIGASKIAYFDFVPLPFCVINRMKREISIWRGQVKMSLIVKHGIELFEERKSDIFKVAGSSYFSRLYNRFAWTAYKYGNKNLAAKLLFKSSFETRSLKDFLKGVSVVLGLYGKYMMKKYGEKRLEEFSLIYKFSSKLLLNMGDIIFYFYFIIRHHKIPYKFLTMLWKFWI